MKKRILICTVVMTLVCSLFCAPALAFSDDAEIGEVYREAVAAMTERGVFEGFEDGSFRPNETLTRAQGAKIITYLCLGKAAAEALRCDKAPFDDVAADRWSALYIAWCVEHDILHGYGNGKYGPADTLTGDQYAKMLLCALGLAREGHYANGGADWYKAVREDAQAAGLYDGDPSMETSQPITRAQAALLSWNAAEAVEAEPQPSPSPASPGGNSGGSPTSAPGGNSVVETPEIGINPDPTPPPTETPIDAGESGSDPDDNGDIPPTPAPDGDSDIETPEIGNDPTPPPTETPIDAGESGSDSDDNGDILLPEVP